jgi:hypothetical protein
MLATRSRRLLAGGLAVAAIGTLATAVAIRAADHRDSTLLTNNPGVDINDVYVFQSPIRPGNTVLAMTVSPFVAPAENGTRYFEPDALYQFKIDTNGDAVEDLVIQAIPVANPAGQRMFILGPAKPQQTGAITQLLQLGKGDQNTVPSLEVRVSAGPQASVRTLKGISAFAGLRDDPFFFDLTQFRAVVGGQAGSFRNPGIDTFAGFNTLAIVIELPSALLGGNPNIGVWATTSRLQSTTTPSN